MKCCLGGMNEMSLDVYLVKEVDIDEECKCHCGNLHTNKITKEEVFHANITHNLCNMAEAAGVYEVIWRPNEFFSDKFTAKDLIIPLEKGLERLKEKPEIFKKFNPLNGWGSYEGLISFIEKYLKASKENPEALIEWDR